MKHALLILLLARPALAESQLDCAVEGACCFPRETPRAVRTPSPRLATLASIAVSGALAKPAAKRALATRTAALGACTRKGEASAHLVVSPSGSAAVSRVVAKPAVGHLEETTALAACVTEALRATSFPTSAGVSELDVKITW